ncbi:MAG TPA: hypothetical protein VER98_12015 [Terriglobia bacterium]|nr:hypothetical protein [Terriglobia bacterium]
MTQRILCVVTLCLCAFVLTGPAQTRPAQVIDQMIEALGGAAFLDVRDIHNTGRFFGFTRGELSSSDVFSDYIKFPDMERTEFGTLSRRSATINRGKEGWKILAKKDPQSQSAVEAEEFLKGFKTSFDYVLRFVLKERQTTIQNLPGEMIDFKRVDVVELRDAEKNRLRFYVDRDTHLPVKMQVRRTDESKLHEEQYANWHKFEGVMTPLFVSRLTDNVKTMEIHLETADYNSGLSDNLFAPPVAK